MKKPAPPTPSISADTAAAPARPVARPAAAPLRFQSLDLLATLVAVVASDGAILYANAALEDALGMSRRSITGALLQDCFTEPTLLQSALSGARGN